ncbi:hypothetical protein AB0N06_05435 [Streptomyces sp. NPDC051020]|uniref:DUF7224 domain-containing protein n=1 Tax=Streptomyces sp. NPDC051020 TaxID=3155409 RepID=UPI003416B2E5
MIFFGNLRGSATPWLALPALIYMAMFVSGGSAVPGYGISSGELSSWAIVVIAPAAAGAAAWESGRQRQLGALRTVATRSMISQILRALAPVLVLQTLLVVGALIVARSATGVWPSPDVPGLLPIAHLVVLPCGWMVVGWGLGQLLPRGVAAPTAAVFCWFLLAMTQAMQTPFWRHLGGFISEGSTLTDVLDPSVYWIPWMVSFGLAGAAALLIQVRRRPWILAVSAVIVACTFILGRLLVVSWSYSLATTVRTGHTTCVGSSPALCLPDEYANQAAAIREDVLPVLRSLHAAGLPAPETLRMESDKQPTKPGVWPLNWDTSWSPQHVESTIADSAVGGIAALAGVRDCHQPSLQEAWALVAAGVPQKSIRAAMTDSGWKELQNVLATPSAEQVQWFTRHVQSQDYCQSVAS